MKPLLVIFVLLSFNSFAYADSTQEVIDRSVGEKYVQAIYELAELVFESKYSEIRDNLNNSQYVKSFAKRRGKPRLIFVDLTFSEGELREFDSIVRSKASYEAEIAFRDLDIGKAGHFKVETTNNPYFRVAELIETGSFYADSKEIRVPGEIFVLLENGETTSIEEYQLSDRSRQVLMRMLRFIIFEEIYHGIERQAKLKTNKYFVRALNTWIGSRKLPAFFDYDSRFYERWDIRVSNTSHDIEKAKKTFNRLFPWFNSKYFGWFPETSVYLGGKELIPRYFADRQFVEWVESNHPLARLNLSPIMKLIRRVQRIRPSCRKAFSAN